MIATLSLALLPFCTLVQSAPGQVAEVRGVRLAQRTSPLGTTRLRLMPARGDVHELVFDLEVTTQVGSVHRIPALRGNGFYVSDLERIIVIDACESTAVATSLQVIDLDGRVLHRREVHALTHPTLSPLGDSLAYRTPRATTVLDLASFVATDHPPLDRFVLRRDGSLVGVERRAQQQVRLWDERGADHLLQLQAPLRELIVPAGSSSAFLLTGVSLTEVDLRSGAILAWSPTSLSRAPTPPAMGDPVDPMPTSVPWPLAPVGGSDQRAIGNTYAEYQRYGTTPYMHPGIDVLGMDLEPVYAVRSGFVKAVLTTSAQYHWRIAIGDSDSASSTDGYLYAHLDQPTIAVSVGDFVTRGQFLGNLVPWPVPNFTHCHFARIRDEGVQWNGGWLCTRSPHVRLRNQTENAAPFFENAVGSDLFAFCLNETSTYLDPAALAGEVDIVVKLGDIIESTWVCSVQEIRYSIYSEATMLPVVQDKLAVRFDMPLDTYQNGPFDPFLVGLLYKEDGTCDTNGNYDFRDFYHVVTNSDGNEIYEAADAQEAWNTTLCPDGNYTIEVTAWDAAGNAASQAMVVTVANN